MTRGAQRDRDRLKAQARAAKTAKKSGSGMSAMSRNQTDAEKLAAKRAAKEKAKAEGKVTGKQRNNGTKNPYAGMKKMGKNEKIVNPHTGKKDAKLTAKALKSQGKGGKKR
jgi:hypothetical protein